jgi:hypothetical protein
MNMDYLLQLLNVAAEKSAAGYSLTGLRLVGDPDDLAAYNIRYARFMVGLNPLPQRDNYGLYVRLA